MSDTSLATFQDSTTHPGFLRSVPLTARPQARWVIAGVPWDGATTNRPGARFGPAAIRRASHMLSDGTHPLFGVSPVGDIADAGDLPLPSTSLGGMREAMGPLVDRLLPVTTWSGWAVITRLPSLAAGVPGTAARWRSYRCALRHMVRSLW
jgi:agmatinase